MAAETPRFAISDVSQYEIDGEDTKGKAVTNSLSAHSRVNDMFVCTPRYKGARKRLDIGSSPC